MYICVFVADSILKPFWKMVVFCFGDVRPPIPPSVCPIFPDFFQHEFMISM